jgi:hypothetical protein
MVEESVRKTAAKKTVRKAVGRTAAVKRAPRTKALLVEETESTPSPSAPVKRPRRKAPTPVAETKERAARSNVLLYTGAGVFVVLTVLSTIIGFTDRGAINVQSIIESRIAGATPEERARLEQAQKATANNVPDGGLVLSDTQAVPSAPVATTTPSTASSTDALASTTEAAPSQTDTLQPDDGLVPSE